MSWWMGKRRLQELQQQCTPAPNNIEQVPMAAVMDAIDLCAMHEWPIPQWAAQPFRLAVMRLRFYEARTWDEVLGPFVKLPPGAKQWKAESNRRALEWPVYSEIAAEIAKDGGLRHGGTDGDVCDVIGARYGISKNTAWAYYDAVRKRLDEIRAAGIADRAKRDLPES
jgi:hypothetical protein